jgi:hypothetical protein
MISSSADPRGARKDICIYPTCSKALAQLDSEAAGTWGCSRLWLYDAEDVRNLAVQLYGIEGLKKKLEARRKKEATKRMREVCPGLAAVILSWNNK